MINMNPTQQEQTVTVARLKRLDSRDGYVIVVKEPYGVQRAYGPATKAECDCYMRSFKENNPGAYARSVIVPPRNW